jgi:hypothetical protein
MASRRLHTLVSSLSNDEAADLETRLEGKLTDSVEEQVAADEEASKALHERLFGQDRGRGSDHPAHAAVITPPN